MDSSSKPRGATLSNLEVSKAVEKMKKDSEASNLALRTNSSGSNSKKLKRRNSISNHSFISHGALSPKGKKQAPKEDSPFPGIRLHTEVAIEDSPTLPPTSPLSPESPFKRKKGKLKEQFSGLFKQNRRSSSNNSIDKAKEKSSSDLTKKCEKYTAQVILLQRFWRMCAARRARKCFPNASAIASTRKNLEEILRNEEHYIIMLQTLKQQYIVPLSSLKKSENALQSAIAGESIPSMFPGIDYTITCHTLFIKKLRGCIDNWPKLDFSLMLLDHVTFLTEIYEKMPNTLSNAESMLQRLQKKQAFIDYCRTALKEHPPILAKRSLKYLITSPLSYMYKFEENCRPLVIPLKRSAQLRRMLTVEAITTQLGSYLQEKMELQECSKIIYKLQHVIGQREKDKLSTKSSRRFLRDRALRVNGKPSRVFLFSDLLYITHEKNATLKFTASYPLTKLRITNSSRVQCKKGVRCTYYVLSGEKEYKFRETAAVHASSFIFLLEEYVTRSKDPVFGLPLEKAMPDPQTLPVVFRKTIYHLSRAEDKTNIFRRPTNPPAVVQLRINESQSASNDISGSHRDDVAGLLLMYLELMPDCILKFSDVMNCPDLKYQVSDGSNHRRVLKHIQILIQRLSEKKRNFLEYLTYFLARLAASGKISTWELAHYFTQHIIRCENDKDINYCRQQPILVRITNLIITRRDKLFRIEKPSANHPDSIEQFLESDPFGVWWKLFRESDKHFIRYITSTSSIQTLISHLVGTNANSNEVLGELAKNVLMTEIVTARVLENSTLLNDFFDVLDTEITEEGIKWLMNVVGSFFRLEPLTIANYLLSSNRSEKLIQRIGSGNISLFMEDIVKKSASEKQLYPLLASWCVMAFDQMLKTEYSLVDDTLCNTVDFLCSAWHEEGFIHSESFSTFQNHLSIDKLKEFVGLALSTSRQSTACCIQRAISTLIASKELSSVAVPTNSGSTIQLDDSEVSESAAMYQSAGLLGLAESWRQEEEESEESEGSSEGNENEHSEYHEQDVASESNFNSSSEEEVVMHKRGSLNRTSSFSSLRWSECLKSIVNSKTDIERTNLLSLFLAQHDKMKDILLDQRGNNKQAFGSFRLGLLQILQVTVFASDDKIIEQLIKSNLLGTCIKVFFAFPGNSIMHHVVQDTVIGVLQRDNDSLLYHLLLDANLVKNILEILQDPKFEEQHYKGHVKEIIKALKENNQAALWIKNGKLKSDWEKFTKNL